MDLGLYQLKYGARKVIQGLLPVFKNVSPNLISWAMVPVGAGVAGLTWMAAQGQSGLWFGVIGLTILRMFLGTMDGLVAQHYGKSTPGGEVVNRLTPELCDLLYLGTLAAVRPEWTLWGIGALLVAWLTTFSGLIGLSIGKPIQSVGPVGQTDRLVAFMVLALLSGIAPGLGWGTDFILIFLVWVVGGGAFTVVLRLYRTFRKDKGQA